MPPHDSCRSEVLLGGHRFPCALPAGHEGPHRLLGANQCDALYKAGTSILRCRKETGHRSLNHEAVTGYRPLNHEAVSYGSSLIWSSCSNYRGDEQTENDFDAGPAQKHAPARGGLLVGICAGVGMTVMLWGIAFGIIWLLRGRA